MPFAPPMPRSFTNVSVRKNAPAAPGVYGISNAREWIYIGQTENIQAALMGHLGDSGAAIMSKRPTGFIFEVCDLASRATRLDRLVREYRPTCNQLAEGRAW